MDNSTSTVDQSPPVSSDQESGNANVTRESQAKSAGKKTAGDWTKSGAKSSVYDEPWEASLTDDSSELKILEELGLGVAIDITVKQPWARKSAFQAKSVLQANDLIATNESNQFLKTSQHVESYSEMQAGLESKFRPDPSKPISVHIAVDFHRNHTKSKTIKGTTVLTRTVAFRAKDPTTRRQDNEEKFERNLHTWLQRQNLVSCKDCGKNPNIESCQCANYTYNPKTNHYCIDYLRELGGVTHYVSSITLGATKYHIERNSTLFRSLSNSTGVSVASTSEKTKASRKAVESCSKQQQVGKVPQYDDGNLRELLKFRTKGEAVVQCSYNSLSNLVFNLQLRKYLELGIQEYIDLQKNGTRGPYHIATAEMMYVSEESDERKRLYWKVCPHREKMTGTCGDRMSDTCRYLIEGTFMCDEASNFYLKPTARKSGKEIYFYIVTDPEDVPKLPKSMTARTKAVHADIQESPQTQPAGEDPQATTRESTVVPAVEPDCEPQRYIQIHEHTNHLEAELLVSKSHSAFKLKCPQDNTTCSLSRSQWLPKASLGSQPYIICYKRKSLLSWHHTQSVCIERKDDKYVVSHTENHHLKAPLTDCLFVLEFGHKS